MKQAMKALLSRRALLRWLPVLLVLAMSIAAGAVFFSARTTEARLLLEDAAAGDAPSALKARTKPPSKTVIGWTVEGRAGLGDLYLPADETPVARLVLLPGLVSEGRTNPQLQAFANSLARSRFAVLVPEIASFRSLHLSPADARVIADALRALSEWHGRPALVGLAAVSYALGPALIATLEPDGKDRVAFVLGIGGYYDLVAAVTYATTGCFRGDATKHWRCRTPNNYGKWVFARINANRIENRPDRATLQAIAARKLNDPNADIGDLLKTLGPEGRTVTDLLLNADPNRVVALIARLPEAVRADFDRLSPAHFPLSEIAAEVILIHGRNDALIPPTESKKLAKALSHAHLTLVAHIAHVEFTGPLGLMDDLALLRAARRLIAIRDRMGASTH
jgi:pimeloyl-ACP methyl ester carboxylesterase